MIYNGEKIKVAVSTVVNKTRGVPKRLTAGVAIGLFELFLTIWPNMMSDHWQTVTYKAIGVISATGIADWAWRNRKQASNWIKNKFHKKEK